MTETFTLHVDINTLSDAASRRITILEIRSMPGPLTGDPDITFESESRYEVVNGQADILLPQDADPPGYAFLVRAPQLDMTWVVPPPDDPDVTVNLSDYGSDLGQWQDAIADAFLGYDEETSDSSVVIDGSIGVHARTLTTDATLTVTGGSDGSRTWLYVVPNGHLLIWETEFWERTDPYLVIFVHALDEWHAFLQEPTATLPPAGLDTGVSLDTDGEPYADLDAIHDFVVFYDDEVPYYDTGTGGVPLLQDVDAVPFLTLGA